LLLIIHSLNVIIYFKTFAYFFRNANVSHAPTQNVKEFIGNSLLR